MELSSTAKLMLIVSLCVVYFIVWIVTVADVFHQGGVTPADRALWVAFVTVIPVLGFIVYWLMANKLAEADPTNNTSRRASRRRSEPKLDENTELH